MAVPGFPADQAGSPSQPRGTVRQVSAFDRAAQVAGSVAAGAERALNSRLGFNVREGVGELVSTVRGAQVPSLDQLADRATQIAGDAFGSAERALNSRLGFSVRDAASELASTVRGAQFPSLDQISDGASQIAGSVFSGAERALNSKLGFNVRDAAGDLMDTISGKPKALEDLSEQIFGKVGGLAAALLGEKSAATQWGNLSPHLIARMYPCDSKGVEIIGPLGPTSIFSPITDANFEVTLNWQSPFESSGPENKAPALMAMIQTGQIATVANAIQAFIPGDNALTGILDSTAEKAKQYARELEGRTGITKLNSRQVFAGMPPIKVTMTLHFRAISDPQTEVMEPYRRLLEWALPQQLAEDGILTELLKSAKSGDDIVKALFPSLAPQLIGFNYANERYSPMVIESVSNPIDGPLSSNGIPIYRAVQVSLATLTALDKNDVAKLFRVAQ